MRQKLETIKTYHFHGHTYVPYAVWIDESVKSSNEIRAKNKVAEKLKTVMKLNYTTDEVIKIIDNAIKNKTLFIRIIPK